MRAFIAVSLPDHVRESLGRLQQQLARSGADVAWVAPDRLHLTLKFLGEISDAQRPQIEAVAALIAHRQPQFQANLSGVGAFPSLTAPRVVWVGIEEGKDQFIRMAAGIEEEGQALGLRREEHPFSAHLTLGRVRSPNGRPALVNALQNASWQPPAGWTVSTVTVYQSVLSSNGPTYSILAELPLAA